MEFKLTSAKSVARDVFDNFPEDEQQFLREVASEAKRILNEQGPEQANDFIKSQRLDSDEYVAFWSMFDSKQRASMKKVEK